MDEPIPGQGEARKMSDASRRWFYWIWMSGPALILLGLTLSWVLDLPWGGWFTTAGLVILMVQSFRLLWFQSKGVALDFTSFGVTAPLLLAGAAPLVVGLQLALGPLVDEFPFLPFVGYSLALTGAGLIIGTVLHQVRRWSRRRQEGAPK
ncbi:hypothetical protein ACFFGH_10735 [Lysobacter korlensis]|uniref:Uncharacterized protein n=1 Tax=Lysobacter korlensis TaxID=553636 RepID=A0ABV6RND6_9GAMM